MDYFNLIHQLDAPAWQRIAFCFALSTLLIPLMLPLARRFGLVDHPGGRKDHGCAMPVVGGLVIYFVVVAGFLLFEETHNLRTAVFLGGAGLLVLVGQLDDYYDLRWTWRIGAQSLAALLMAMAGVMATNLQDVFGFMGANIGLMAVPFTVFIVVGVINALNMADGVDGLAGSLSVVALVLYACFGLYAGNVLVVERILAVAAAVLGFLVWNARFPWQSRAKVFLGNGGSMLLGFTIAYASVRLSQSPDHPITPVLGPWALALPLIDCVTLMIRRWRQGRSPFAADRHHMHHMLLDAGFRATQVVAIIAGGSLLLGIGAAMAVKLGIYRPLVVLAFLVLLAAWYAFSVDYDRAVARLARWRGGDARAVAVPSRDAAESEAH